MEFQDPSLTDFARVQIGKIFRRNVERAMALKEQRSWVLCAFLRTPCTAVFSRGKSRNYPERRTSLGDNFVYCLALTGGGTAGHVWPHLALFDSPMSSLKELHDKGELRVIYFGSALGMERELITKHAPTWKYHPIATGKLRRYFSFQNFVDPFKIGFGVLQAFFALIKNRPNVLFSKGGYVSAPVVWAAWILKIPIVIHESDLTPALATKLTSPFATSILCAFEGTKSMVASKWQNKVSCMGLPLRNSLFSASKADALKFFKFDANQKVLLIFGGSLGADGLNKNLLPFMPQLCDFLQVIHIVGKGKLLEFSHPNYRPFEFLHSEMRLAYAAADIAISRAGASSIFELAAANIPMILVPLGLGASRGDQIENAKEFGSRQLAVTLFESQFSAPNSLQSVDKLTSQSTVPSAQPPEDRPNFVSPVDLVRQVLANADSYKTRFEKLKLNKSAMEIAAVLVRFMGAAP